jgi:glutamine amidotransferase
MKSEMNNIYLFNTGISNFLSVEYAFKELNYQVKKISNFEDITEESLLVVPGVGHFDNIMHKLEESNFQNIRSLIDDKKLNFLGICLGMQILFDDSSEGNKRGLGLLEGSVKKLTDRFYDDEYISTNVGWRKVIFEQQEKFSQFNNNFFYFVHQYEAVPKNENDIIAYTQKFNKNIVAAVKKENICGIQFHPEKSGQNGIKFLNSLIKGFYE